MAYIRRLGLPRENETLSCRSRMFLDAIKDDDDLAKFQRLLGGIWKAVWALDEPCRHEPVFCGVGTGKWFCKLCDVDLPTATAAPPGGDKL